MLTTRIQNAAHHATMRIPSSRMDRASKCVEYEFHRDTKIHIESTRAVPNDHEPAPPHSPDLANSPAVSERLYDRPSTA
jgi:hypothetical protein